MKKKRTLVIVTALSAALSIGVAITAAELSNNSLAYAEDINNFWYHYEQVTPTWTKHGSKEFWANCSTHDFVLTEPAGTEEIKEGVAFDSTKYFDELEEDDPRYLPPISEKVDIKVYLQSLVQAFTHDPYSFIPETMRPDGVSKVTESQVTYDFTEFTNVSSIQYGGFGEQWHMVIENIKESERFYKVTEYGSEIIGAANLVVYAFLDDYYDGTVSKTFNDDSRFTAKIDFDGGVLNYTIQFKTSVNLPLFGAITPQIDMKYVLASSTKTVRFQLGEGNALKFVITPNSYTFALEYGIETVSRKAYFTVSKDEEDNVEGHIYEFIRYKEDKDLTSSCADFYIGETYTSVVGNKAGALIGFEGFINELYETEQGKLIGYKVRETFEKWTISKTYNTLWFNLNNISGINCVKAIDNGSVDPHENNHDVYLNNQVDIFEPKRNEIKVLFVTKQTSRRYDVEMRKQFFYSLEDDAIVEHGTSIPMMFIQDDGTEEGETNYSTFQSDILSTNGISASVNLANKYLQKIRSDYLTLIDIFIAHKGDITSQTIIDYIGNPVVIE